MSCTRHYALRTKHFSIWDFGCRIADCELKKGVRSQNPEFRRKAIEIEFSSNTGYRLLTLCSMLHA